MLMRSTLVTRFRRDQYAQKGKALAPSRFSRGCFNALVEYALFAVLVIGVAIIAASRPDVRGVERRQAVIERKLDLVMRHLGIVEETPAMPDVVDHLRAGKKINAIKAYRQRTGVGLAEAKFAVEQLARQLGL